MSTPAHEVGALRHRHAPVLAADDLVRAGRAARRDVPRRSHAELVLPSQRDPVGVLRRQNGARLQDLVPLRMERMLQNPFTFYRGTAALQAADLAAGASTGVDLTVCGDAHLTNFGLYASPQRTMTFDLNDFDEAAYGPWEWDVKRLVTSVVVAARHKGLDETRTRQAAAQAAASYRVGLRQVVELEVLDRYYARVDPSPASLQSQGLRRSTRKVLERALRASERRTSRRVVEKITEVAADGSVAIREDPPVLTHIRANVESLLAGIVHDYLSTVPPDVANLLAQYTTTDAVRRVVGVGSVGTRCFIVVLTGPSGEPLVLQIKEATRSVLCEHGGAAGALPPALVALGAPDDHGYRVVANQRILQAVSDPFLGHIEVDGHHYYVRQFRDRNVSFDIDALKPGPFVDYVGACGVALARAHAQSERAPFVAGYLGGGRTFDDAVVDWAFAYADRSATDYEQVREAAARGAFDVVPDRAALP